MTDPAFPLISVVIAFLNEAQLLPEAIESVLRQDYPHWQLLLVDDGSTDESTAIAIRYAAQSEGKIVYCEHPGHVNKGLSASRNYGISQSAGPLLALLDADDVWQPTKLSQQLAIFRAHPEVAMVAEASLYWHSWQDGAAGDVLIPVGAPANRVYQPTELSLLLYPLGEGAAPCPSGLMLTKQAWHMAGGFEESFTKNYQLYEDQAFLSKIYLKEHVYVSDACQNLYRQRQGSIVQSVKAQGQYHHVRRYFLEWLVEYVRAKQISNVRLDAALAKALFRYHHPTLNRVAEILFSPVVKRVLNRVKALR
jgi:glycosyltransferase involved in cell wall biosynthesis